MKKIFSVLIVFVFCLPVIGLSQKSKVGISGGLIKLLSIGQHGYRCGTVWHNLFDPNGLYADILLPKLYHGANLTIPNGLAHCTDT